MSIEPRKTKSGKDRYLVRVRAGEVLVASKTFALKSDAEKWEREQKHRLDTGRPLPPRRGFKLQQLVDEFQQSQQNGNPHTVNTDRDNLTALPTALLSRPLASIQAGDIREHLLAQLRSGKAPSTVARAKTTLSALFTYADGWGLLHQPHPVRTMKRIPELSITEHSVSPADVPTPEQLAARIRAVREHRPDLADVYEFESLTGLRRGELRAARLAWLIEAPCRSSPSSARTPPATRRRDRNPGAAPAWRRCPREASSSSAPTPQASRTTTICSPTSAADSSRSASSGSSPSASGRTRCGTTPPPPGCGRERPSMRSPTTSATRHAPS
ncbi:MAG TPA: hypothetical protein VGC45_04975 [Gryllotalpicola sp.]